MTLQKIFTNLCLVIWAIIPVFSPMMNRFMPFWIQYALIFLMLIFALLSNIKDGKLIVPISTERNYIFWILVLLMAFTGVTRDSYGSFRIMSCILLPLILRKRTDWIKSAFYIFAVVLGINVFFTLFFFLFPQYYHIIIDIYGSAPIGTSLGTAGYRAGISNHYSQNGIFISLFFMLIMVLIISGFSVNKKIRDNVKYIVIAGLAFAALLLTGKRGVLIFCICSIIFTYLLCSRKKLGKLVKIFIIAIVAVGILQMLSEVIPEIGYTFERFQLVGEDTASQERFAMWELAIQKFKNHPIIGNGFWSFKDFYHDNLSQYYHSSVQGYDRLNAHNVYLQLLCENGIVGEVIYLSAVGLMLAKTIKLIRNMYQFDSMELRFAALFSLCIQIFYCIYSVSGNCLYDVVFYFYALAMAITLALSNELNQYPTRLNTDRVLSGEKL